MASASRRISQVVASALKHIANKDSGARFSHAGCRAYSVASGGTTALIKQLRERTGAPMKDVKAVLQQCDWDSEAAFTELRKKGLAAASNKAGRVAADGLLGFAQEGRSAVVVEINSETDFVAKNDPFQHLLSQVVKAALCVESTPTSEWEANVLNMETLKCVRIQLDHAKLQGESTVQESVAEVGAIMGENVNLRRGFHVSTPSGFLCSYCHATVQPNLARILMLPLRRQVCCQL